MPDALGLPIAAAPAPPIAASPPGVKSLWIAGEPAAWIGAGEKEWQERVTSACREAGTDAPPQWIDVEFRFLAERLYRKDIDNLLTPNL